MKTLFFLFTVFWLLLLELWLGNLTIYLPLVWMGFFYFAVCRYSFKLLFIFGLIFAIIMDAVLYQRFCMPDIFIFAGVMYMSWRYRDFWDMSVWSGGIHGCWLIIYSYMFQTVFGFFINGFSVAFIVDAAAQMTALLPAGFVFQALLIYTFDKMQKRLRFEKYFIVERKNDQISIYRRRGEYSR